MMRTTGKLGDELPPLASIPVSHKVTGRGKAREVVRYLDIALSFDCETYSFTVVNERGEREKRAIMWAWGLAIGDVCYMGRTWNEFIDAIATIVRKWEISLSHRCIVWVHNLSYDFQFFRKWFRWNNVFALSSREICYGVTVEGVEFRCSYILTGYGLEKVGEHLTSHNMKKLSGTIDYNVARHPQTVLTEEEIAYLEHDCLVVTAHIEEQIEVEKGLASIPLTKTAYVRRDVRGECFKDETARIRYGGFIRGMYLDTFIYESLHRAFAGGFTHANAFHSGETMENVSSYDFASAYPAVMCSEYFPATPPQLIQGKISLDEFRHNLQYYLCVFTVTLYDVESKFNYDHYISSSHCIFPEGAKVQLDNGRVVKASQLTTTITNVDWEIIVRCYKASRIDVAGLIRWGKGYLPKPIIECVIRYFQSKTTLKGVAGMEQEYMTAKENLNSIYGMMVQNPLRAKVPYDLESNAWGEMKGGLLLLEVPLTEEERIKALDDYNGSFSRFTYYAWGVFVTAYCRKNLWRGIFHFGPDYCYADTDSLKVLNGHTPEHLGHINKHNETIQKKIKACLAWHGMDPALSEARNKKLGVWEYEGDYTRFKTLGAKRYMIEEEGKYGKHINITVSGVNKREAVPYIISQTAGPKRAGEAGGGDPFEYFSEGMIIPPGHAGKMIPFYGDHEITGKIRDRDGVIYEYEEKSFEYMEPGGYSLSLGGGYAEYLDMLRKGLI